MADARKTALKALNAVFDQNGYSNLVIDKMIKQDNLSGVDAAFAAALFYGVIERRLTLDYIIEKAAKRSIEKIDKCCVNILRLGAYQIYYMDKVPNSAAVNEAVKQVKKTKKAFLSGFCNAVLREITRNAQIFLPSSDRLDLVYSCDESIVNLLIRDYGRQDAEKILAESFTPCETVLRVNTLKTTKEELAEKLMQEGVEVEKVSQNALAVKKTGAVENLSEYSQGLFHVQSLVSQICAEAVGAVSGERVLDCCAAPGGKSFTIAQIMQNCGEILSCDIHPHRVELIKKGAKRLGIDCIKPTVLDATCGKLEGEFDKILCDVPCSGLGMINQKPEIKYKKAEVFEELENIQFAILQNTSKYLKKGGRLVYSTCTVNSRENGGIVEKFLQQNSDFLLVSEKTYLPHIDKMEGFYIAVLERC